MNLDFGFYWKEITSGITLIGTISFDWKFRNIIRENFIFFFGLKKRIEAIEKGVGPHPLASWSQDVFASKKLCPECMKPMKIQSREQKTIDGKKQTGAYTLTLECANPECTHRLPYEIDYVV
jgi:hypothetical protein